MLVYLLTYFFILVSNLIKLKFSKRVSQILTLFVVLYFTIFIGLRYQVGADWEAYLSHYQNLELSNFLRNLLSWDPGYVVLEYISKIFGFGVYGVNVLCAIIFMSSFVYFSKVFRIPLSFSLLIAFPYLIMVVVNGYSRQGVAIGLSMVVYSLYYQNKIFKSFIFYILAILFHKITIISGLIYFSKRKFDLRIITLLFIIFYVVYNIFKNNFDVFLRYYFLSPMQSGGGIIRILVNVLAASLFFIFYKHWKYFFPSEYQIWKIFSLFSVFILFFTLLTKATTVGDRIVLYFYPLQIVVFYRTLLLIRNRNLKYAFFTFVVFLYSSELIGWLLFATHRSSWLPYDNLLFRII